MDSEQPEVPKGAAPAAPEGLVEAPESLHAVGVKIVEQLKTVYDPEIPVDIYELGLIYKVRVDEAGAANVRMTLTTPMCPAAEVLPPEVESKVRDVEGVTSVTLDLVWDPPWSPEMMSEAARLELGFF